jgi:hypothetical protein
MFHRLITCRSNLYFKADISQKTQEWIAVHRHSKARLLLSATLTELIKSIVLHCRVTNSNVNHVNKRRETPVTFHRPSKCSFQFFKYKPQRETFQMKVIHFNRCTTLQLPLIKFVLLNHFCVTYGIMRYAYNVLVGKPEGKRPFTRSSCRREDNSTINRV